MIVGGEYEERLKLEEVESGISKDAIIPSYMIALSCLTDTRLISRNSVSGA